MSPRSGRQSLAQGGVSGANRNPGYRDHYGYEPALAGERFCRPLKRAWRSKET